MSQEKFDEASRNAGAIEQSITLPDFSEVVSKDEADGQFGINADLCLEDKRHLQRLLSELSLQEPLLQGMVEAALAQNGIVTEVRVKLELGSLDRNSFKLSIYTSRQDDDQKRIRSLAMMSAKTFISHFFNDNNPRLGLLDAPKIDDMTNHVNLSFTPDIISMTRYARIMEIREGSQDNDDALTLEAVEYEAEWAIKAGVDKVVEEFPEHGETYVLIESIVASHPTSEPSKVHVRVILRSTLYTNKDENILDVQIQGTREGFEDSDFDKLYEIGEDGIEVRRDSNNPTTISIDMKMTRK
jgi:hypothetical protein